MVVFPARAGMSRKSVRLDNVLISVPRASGDEPHLYTRRARVFRVFPARAGMSRYARPLGCSCRRVPRASGDEPQQVSAWPTAQACSPRERG